MGDLQQHLWSAARSGAHWPIQPGPRHPLAAGVLCVALAVGAWQGLVWRLGQTAAVDAPVPPGVSTAKAHTEPTRENRRLVVAPPAPSVSPSRTPAAPRRFPKPSMLKVLRDWASKVLSTSPLKATSDSARRAPGDSASRTRSNSAPKASSRSSPKVSPHSALKALRDSAPRAKLSPFRRSHPWAAPSRGRYYYPSSCPATLKLPDLVFFRTEAEARDSGFESSGRPPCE
jgi:hypothetical protein